MNKKLKESLKNSGLTVLIGFLLILTEIQDTYWENLEIQKNIIAKTYREQELEDITGYFKPITAQLYKSLNYSSVFLVNYSEIEKICGKNAGGCHQSHTHNIFLLHYSNKNLIDKAMLHELGHRFWSGNMTILERTKWKIITDYKQNDAITNYAKTNIREDFAENVKFYYTSNHLQNPKKYEYLEKLFNKYGLPLYRNS